MKVLDLALLLGGVAALFAVTPVVTANAQDAAVVSDHGNWTLREREEWLHHRIDVSRDNGALDRVEYDHVRRELNDIRHQEDSMRDHQDGQLTDNQTANLEARLDDVAAHIHWLNQASLDRPW